jgi:hypothetical protein
MNAAVATESTGRVFNVLLWKREYVEAALVGLAKRAVRKGLTPVSWSWGKAFTTRHHTRDSVCVGPGCGGCEDVARLPLTLVGEVPHYAGWRFIAALEHLDGENITRTIEGEKLPREYRTRGPVCDHCQVSRRRSDTYVLQHVDGRFVQVGSTCIDDFLGCDYAGKLADAASLLAVAYGIAGDGEEGPNEGMGGSRQRDFPLTEYLPLVSWAVEVMGWVSRRAAREQDSEATADASWTFMLNPRAAREAKVEVTADHGATALAAAEWAENLTDAEVDAESGDYLHNLRAIARNGYVNTKSAGLAASMIVAYQRHLARERRRNERAAGFVDAYVGEVGKRVTFGLPPKLGKRGKLLKGAPVVLSASAVILDFVTGYDTDFGYMTVCKFKSAEGALLVWKSTSVGLSREDVGKRYLVAGTIKTHSEYKGAKQTILSRCTLTPEEAT